ncbi:MAG: hypothetical protein AAF502_16010 [Bacteroidota bacterium]
MKKIIAKEFIWFLITFVISFPLGLLFLWILGYTTEVMDLGEAEKDYILFLYLIGYVVSFVSVYLIRFTSIAIKALAEAGKEALPRV